MAGVDKFAVDGRCNCKSGAMLECSLVHLINNVLYQILNVLFLLTFDMLT